ncbi:MAG: site-specific DNA-methyltransferase [Pontiellaceae bacterium]|nr:site-specific DNA-methyltransferase [Pontiellaceae bacterium]
MPFAEQLRSRLLKKLSELFQLDQPDLDFGFYRIMHARAREIQNFIGNDLLNIVADAFGGLDQTRKAELKARIDQEITIAKEYGVADPENSPKVKEARAAYDAVKDTAGAEADVYDHLYRFFERYYDDGDFISRRYYTREASGKAAPFAVPYNGEEVKLHWANADQYYIKSAEYFSNFTFDLTQSAEFRKMSKEERELHQIPESPLTVHFRVVEATEGEHCNVKVSEATKRFFILHAENPVALTEPGELVVHFEYRPDPEKTGQEGAWRDKRNAEAVEAILDFGVQIADLSDEELAAKFGLPFPIPHLKSTIGEYFRLFKEPAPTENDKKRPVLAKYVNQYTARNTMDYFIHKDLGGFLHRELDFYIKNEIMRLDDIENAEAPAVESYLARIRVLRRIAGKLIDFLAQLEDFQKKLWLKKKFVVETNYCITLDRVPEELYPVIAANEAQCEEWIRLFAIDEIGEDAPRKDAKARSGDLFGERVIPFSRPLTVAFLKANDKLVLDTRFFDESFKARLLASIENFDEQCDGLLVHSENFQALNLLQERYREQVKCVYIDPPYNTGGDGFAYKDSYQHSSWLSMFAGRMECFLPLMSMYGVFFSSIDDNEMSSMKNILDNCFGFDQFESQIIIQSNKRGQTYQSVAKTHEYLFCYIASQRAEILELPKVIASNALRDDGGHYELWELRNRNPKFGKHNRPNLYYPIYVDAKIMNEDGYARLSLIKSDNFSLEVFPKNSEGKDSCWRWGKEKVAAVLSRNDLSALVAKKKKDGGWNIYEKARKGSTKTKSIWTETEVINEQGTVEVGSLGFTEFGFPKPTGLLKKVLQIGSNSEGLILDYFSGSGTTGHAVINLNREDGGKRKYILVEMGDYFDTVLKPRIAKVVYSESWKDGKPTARHSGISHCFKTIRLESYEDTLNNLRKDDAGTNNDSYLREAREKFLRSNPSLREDYMLHYLLDVETRGSQSLLNIDVCADPTYYTLEVKKPGTDEYVTRAVDLIETFNYLIGLRVVHYAAPQEFTASFKRIEDPEAPTGQKTRLVIDGKLGPINREIREPREDEDHSSVRGSNIWWFRKVEGWAPQDPAHPDNGQREKVLVVWRKLTSDIEQDNLMLDEWFRKNRISARDFEFDAIYVNGSNNLPNLKQDDENWKVRLIEEEFLKRMWEVRE